MHVRHAVTLPVSDGLAADTEVAIDRVVTEAVNGGGVGVSDAHGTDLAEQNILRKGLRVKMFART